MKLTFRITVGGMTAQVEATGTMEAVNRALNLARIQAHINRLLFANPYGTFQVSIDSIK